MIDATTEVEITLSVNGSAQEISVEPRTTLAEALREHCGLTGTHVGCEHGVCGACTVLIDGASVRSCLMFALQATDTSIVTIEGLQGADGGLHPIQLAFSEAHGLQCGFCTPGFVLSVVELLAHDPDPDEEAIREGLSGNLCRCTGYQGIVDAVRRAAGSMKAEEG